METPPDDTGVEIIGAPAVPPSTLELPQSTSRHSTPHSSPSKSTPVSENLEVPGVTPKASPKVSPRASPKSSPHLSHKDIQGGASPLLTPTEGSPKRSPDHSPKPSPGHSPKLTPTDDLPKPSPGHSPKPSPGHSPKPSPGHSPALTPIGQSPKLTPTGDLPKSVASKGSTKSLASNSSSKSAKNDALPRTTPEVDDTKVSQDAEESLESSKPDKTNTQPLPDDANASATDFTPTPTTITITDIDDLSTTMTEVASSKPTTPTVDANRKSMSHENGSPKPHVIKVREKPEADDETSSETKSTDQNAGLLSQADGHQVVTIDTSDETSRRSYNEKEPSNYPQPSPDPSMDEEKGLIQVEKQHRAHHVTEDICKVFGVMFAIGVRLVLMSFCVFTVWLVVYRLQNDYYWLLSLSFLFLILETINIVTRRAGQERKWFCACFMSYLLAVIPCIWILELDKLESFQDAVSTHASSNTNASSVVVNLAGVTANIRLDPNTLLAVTEQCLIFLLILCRWLLPRGDITRDQLSQLLFVFIGMASDVMELFQLFDESNVRKDRTLTYIILSVWSFSLLQFTLVLTMSRSPKKIRTAMDHDDETARIKKKKFKNCCLVMVLTQTELWSLCVAMFMQDGPFLAVRLYTIVTYDLINYTIIFFTCKNILVILLLFYRIMILCLQRNNDDDEEEEEDEKKNDDPRHRSKTVSTRLSLSDVEDDASLPKTSAGAEGNSNDGVRSRHPNQVSPV